MKNWLPILMLLAGLGSSFSTAQAKIGDCFDQPTLDSVELKGQVFDLLGAAIQGASVSVEKDGKSVQESRTDATGRFGLEHLEGNIQLHVSARGFAPGFAFINLGRDLRTLIHPGTIYIILGVGMDEPCPSGTTNRRQLQETFRDNNERYKGSKETNATQK